jgi:hypothetical protein
MVTTALELAGVVLVAVGLSLAFGVGGALVAAGAGAFLASWALSRKAR